MKKNLILIAVCLLSFSCKKDSREATAKTSVYIVSYKQGKLSTGEFVNNRTDAIIRVWKEDNKTLEIKSAADAVDGFAYDANAKISIKADYSAADDHIMLDNVTPGNYFVFIIDTETTSVGRLAWSYKHFSVSAGQRLELRKVFGYSATSAMYENWDSNQ